MNELIDTNLATEINEHHREAQRKSREAIEHARQAGELLIKAKKDLPHGEFQPWVREHCEVGVRQCQKYMKLAQGWNKLQQKTTRETYLKCSLAKALELLSPGNVTTIEVVKVEQPEPKTVAYEGGQVYPTEPKRETYEFVDGELKPRDPLADTVEQEIAEKRRQRAEGLKTHTALDPGRVAKTILVSQRLSEFADRIRRELTEAQVLLGVLMEHLEYFPPDVDTKLSSALIRARVEASNGALSVRTLERLAAALDVALDGVEPAEKTNPIAMSEAERDLRKGAEERA